MVQTNFGLCPNFRLTISSVFRSVQSEVWTESEQKNLTSLFGLTFAQSVLWTEQKTNPKSEVPQCTTVPST